MAAEPTSGGSSGRTFGNDAAPAGPLTPAARRGYGLGSVATGSFGTVPGAAPPALPHRPARRGRRRRGPGRLPPQGLGRHPQPGRGTDQRPLDQPRRAAPARSSSARARSSPLAFVLLFAGPTVPVRGLAADLGRRALPRVRHGLRVLPGALRRDAGRDDRRLRRAHPADDLAGGDPRPHDPRQRWPVTGHPRRARSRVGLPRRRPLRRGRSSSSARSAPGGAPATPSARCRDAPAAAFGDQLQGRRAPRDVPHCCSRRSCSRPSRTGRDARRRRLRRPRCCSARSGASTILFVCFVAPGPARHPAVAAGRRRPAARRTGYVWGVAAARRRRARHPAHRARSGSPLPR